MMIYKMAQDRDENCKDVKGGTVIKDRNGKLLTQQEEVLNVWESYFKELLNKEITMIWNYHHIYREKWS